MQELTLKIKGITPLLCHSPAGMTRKPGIGRKNIPTAEEEAELATYRSKKGLLSYPVTGVRSSLLGGSKGLKQGRTSLLSIVSHIMVFPVEGDELEYIPITDSKWKQVKDYDIDSRRVVVQRAGIIRSRPKFNDWTLKFKIVYDEEMIPNAKELFELIISNSGIKIGLGDYRCEKKGWFGQYIWVD